MKISISCPAGLEGVTKREIYKLLQIETKAIGGHITFDGEVEDIAKCNLYLRTASRVYIELGSFKVQSFDDLFDGMMEIPFEEYIHPNGEIYITATLVESKLTANSATCSVCKKAIYNRIISKTHREMPENGERYKINVSIHRDFATIYLDTSGEGLHKRGYRLGVGDAPLKENVAASLIELSVWNPSRPFVDVFCGSGTLPIEAALIGLNIPSGLNRDFDFLHYKNFDTSFFNTMIEKAKDEINYKQELDIQGFDIDEREIKLSRAHAKNAGVLDYIHFQRADMRDFSSKKSHGVMISNPPYGERLLSRKEIVTLYKDYGEMFRKLDNWCNYSITTVDDFERLFGKKADKKRRIYNGKLDCTYYSFLGKAPQK